MSDDSQSILVYRDGQALRTYSLAKGVLKIGRNADNNIVLEGDERVSRYHAEVRVSQDGTQLTDTGSQNGTFLGEIRLLPNRPETLPEGSSFRIAGFHLVYATAGVEQVAPPESVPPEEREVAAREREAAIARYAAAPPRPTHEPTLPTQGQSAYLGYLPMIFHENAFLEGFLQILEAQWEPSEARQNFISMYFDAGTCPASFLPWLAGWIGVAMDEDWPEPRRRRLLAEGMELYRRRGTPAGLARMLDVCAGLSARIEELPDQPFVFRVRIVLPPSCDPAQEKELSARIVQMHKPAFAGYILEFVSL